MARKYTGVTGVKNQSSQSEAPGQWISPTEVVRELYSSTYPDKPVIRFSPAGSVCWATSSGVVDTELATNDYVLCDGSAISRASNPDLFAAIGTTYGNGDGSTTFNVPDLYNKFTYLKGTTASGTSPTQDDGYITANHSHTFFGNNVTSGRADTNQGEPSRTVGNGNDGNTVNSSQDGQVNVESRHREMIPLLSTNNTCSAPVGSLHSFLLPNWDTAYLPEGFIVSSGQAISRSDFSSVYELMGNLYGNGDGFTTFNIPDLRGLFISGTRQNASVTQPSGVPGYNPDTFLQHFHTYNYEGTTGQNGGSGGGNTNGPGSPVTSTTPASSDSTGPTDSRPDNLSIIWMLAV